MFKLRASSLPDLLDCPSRWEAKHVQGKRNPAGPESVLGTAVHAGTALFDESRMQGAGLTIDDCAGAVVDAVHHPKEEVDWADSKPSEAERIALDLHTLYCREISPQVTFKAVELACNDLELSDLGITLTGTTDRLYEDDFGNIGICDIKTSKTAVSADGTVPVAKHGPQVAVYELLVSTSLGRPVTAPAQIFGLQAAKTARGQRAGIGRIENARELLVGDEYRPGILQMAAHFLKSGMFWGNPSSRLCTPKFCPIYKTCPWRR